MRITDDLWNRNPVGRPENTIQGETWRFTLLTDRLIRMEYQEDGQFEDRPSQVVWNRYFETVPYRVTEKKAENDAAGGFELYTERMHVSYDGMPFSGNGLSVKAAGGLHPYGTAWRYGDVSGNGTLFGNLGGTARTLDEVNGACKLEDGILSLSGCALLNDSSSLVLTEDGWIEPRKCDGIDMYLFVYGCDYKEALRDFYRLTGETPMLPRYALGNWWSRYYAYSEETYMALIRRFQNERIPFSVAVIDMDWHLVEDVDPKYGSPWTGYTWNRKLFPEPERFLAWLHAQGMHTTLNLHPADGIRAYEEAYPAMAKTLGTVVTEHEEAIDFDITDPGFLEAYFDCVLHPEEEKGVDFWWIDWQQGNTSRIPGLDPLWMLNHYHFLDSARDGRRPLTFSRYAGPGSHRYPVGFSGDTIMTWESLQFQPYFTSTASNIGYGWWSHDIGGHMQGYKDDVMAARWVQFGVFSPINRLHSSKSEFNGKEPWRYSMEIRQVMAEFLRLRHQMIPYLYTMNHRAYQEGLPLILPMYYEYPNDCGAYRVKNQYLFGSELLVVPITTPQIANIHRGKERVWLPKGYYIDFFTGIIYRGGRELTMYRSIHSIPVLAKTGAIIPMTGEIMGRQAENNPSTLCICVYAGADGTFTLYEDDNETANYRNGDCVKTEMALDWENRTFTIEPAAGNFSLIPEKRTYEVCVYGVKTPPCSTICVGYEAAESYDTEKGCLRITIPEVPVNERLLIRLPGLELRPNDVVREAFRLLDQAEISFTDKERVYDLVKKEVPTAAKVAELYTLGVDPDLAGAVAEILTADV